MLQILVETTALDLKQINNIAQDKHSITYSLYPCNIFGKDVTERERERVIKHVIKDLNCKKLVI